MSEIRLLAEAELDEYARIRAAAYPGMQRSPQKLVEESRRAFHRPSIHF